MDFLLLGPLEVWRDGRRVTLGPRKAERLLLGLLLMEAGRLIPLERLMSLLWADNPPASARATMHSHFSRLRRQLCPADGSTAVRIVTAGDCYGIETDPDLVDAHRFRSGVFRARELDNPANRAAALAGALNMWRGSVLADVASDDLRARIAIGLEELRVDATEEWFEAQLQCGHHHQVIAELAQQCALHPTRERLTALMIVAQYRCGRPAEALASYARAREVLVAELGVEPGPDLQRLHVQVLRNDPALLASPLAKAPDPAVRAGPCYLPRDASGFVGRVDDLAHLDSLAYTDEPTPGAVLVTTVAGMAGVGKTALALHWAHRAADRFPDGLYYLNLRGSQTRRMMEPIEALGRLLRMLGTPPEAMLDQDGAVAAYRSVTADRRVLIILDDAGTVEQVRAVLPCGPGSLALITSRERMAGLVARDGARRLTLGVLPPEDAVGVLAAVLGADRVRAEPDAAADIAAACGYLPLALRITAANLADRPERSLADEARTLSPGGRLAAFELDDDPDSTLRTVFMQSYVRLQPTERRAFRLLAVHPGVEFTGDVVAALMSDTMDAAAGVLQRLIEAHVVTEVAAGRYIQHDLLREFAADRLSADEAEPERHAAWARLWRFYLASTSSAMALVQPGMLQLPDASPDRPGHPTTFATPTDAAGWLDAELPNLVALAQQAAMVGPPSLAWELGHLLRPYFWQRMCVSEWTSLAELAISAAESEGNDAAAASAYMSAGDLALHQGHHDASWDHYERALTRVRKARWPAFESMVEGAAATTLMWQGRLAEAVERLTRAVEINEQVGRRAGMASKLGNLAEAHFKLGQLRRSAEYFERAHAAFTADGAAASAATALAGLALTRYELGDTGLALDYVTRALAEHEKIGNQPNRPSALATLCLVRLARGDAAGSLAAAEEARRVARDLGYRHGDSLACHALATVHLAAQDVARAEPLLHESLQLAEAGGNAYAAIVARITAADARLVARDPTAAHTHVAIAIAAAADTGQRLLYGKALAGRARILMVERRWSEAREAAAQAVAVFTDTEHRPGLEQMTRVLEQLR